MAYPENDRAVTVAVDGVVRVWKNGGAELDSYKLPFGGLADLSPDGKSVLVASYPDDKDMSKVALWDIEPWKKRWRIEVPVAIAEWASGRVTPDYFMHVRFAPGDRVVVRSKAVSGVAIVNAKDGKILSRFPEKDAALGAAAVSSDGKINLRVKSLSSWSRSLRPHLWFEDGK